jgi:hypothetical protein
MDQIAVERPGRYFIFYTPGRIMIARTKTFAKPAQVPNSPSFQPAR